MNITFMNLRCIWNWFINVNLREKKNEDLRHEWTKNKNQYSVHGKLTKKNKKVIKKYVYETWTMAQAYELVKRSMVDWDFN